MSTAPTMQIGLLGALLGGVLSLLSPCSAMLLPAFFGYAFDRVGMLVRRTAVFLLGLAAVLVPLGAGVAALGSLITVHRAVVAAAGGCVLIALGVVTVLGGGFAVGSAQRATARIRISSWSSVLLLGMVYGFAGFCAGPLLGGVLTVSLVGGDPLYGALLLGGYAVGMTVPLFVLALLWDRLRLGRRRWLRGRVVTLGPLRTHTTSLVSGVLFAGLGVLFLLTDGTAALGGLAAADTQFDLQARAARAAAHVPDPVLLTTGACVALGSILLRRRRAPGTGAARRTLGAAVVLLLVAGPALAVVLGRSTPPPGAVRSAPAGAPGPAGAAEPPEWAGPRPPPIDPELILGRPDAPVILVEFADYQCPFCGTFSREIEPALVDRYVRAGRLAVVWRDFPYYGGQSIDAAVAARAAGRQHRFQRFHDALYADQPRAHSGRLTGAHLDALARRTGLDTARFDADRRDPALRDAVLADLAFGQRLGVPGTPAFLVNGSPEVFGAQPVSVFAQAIDQATATAARPGPTGPR